MNSSRYRLQSKLAPGFRRLRASTTTSAGTTETVTSRPSLPSRQASFVSQERFSFCEDDFLDIDPGDILEANVVYRPEIGWQELHRQHPGESL